MDVSDGALREGVAYELIGQTARGDIRDTTAQTVAERYRVDLEHAAQVEATALDLFGQVRGPWSLDSFRGQKYLHWASLLHETGLTIAYSGNHKHAAYLVRHSEMPGFSREQQATLAAMLESQRRRFRPKQFEKLASDRGELAERLTVLLRLAILLNRPRNEEGPPEVQVTRASEKHLDLLFPADWLETHPLMLADLEEEAEALERIELHLAFQ